MAFIRQESLEKARELRAKADEEASVEKASLTAHPLPATGRQWDRLSTVVEQGKIVRQETANIDASFEKRKKQVEVQKRMSVALLSDLGQSSHAHARSSGRAKSNQTNKARLQQLDIREELLGDVFESASKGLAELTKDEGKYAELLEKLTLQVPTRLEPLLGRTLS